MKRESGEEGELSMLTEGRKWLRSENIHQRCQGLSTNCFCDKIDLRKRSLLSRLMSYSQYSSDTTSVTPGFKDKTECIAICMPGSSFIHIETS